MLTYCLRLLVLSVHVSASRPRFAKHSPDGFGLSAKTIFPFFVAISVTSSRDYSVTQLVSCPDPLPRARKKNRVKKIERRGGSGVASFPVLPTPAFVSQPWRKSAARQKLGWGGLGTRLGLVKFIQNDLYSAEFQRTESDIFFLQCNTKQCKSTNTIQQKTKIIKNN